MSFPFFLKLGNIVTRFDLIFSHNYITFKNRVFGMRSASLLTENYKEHFKICMSVNVYAAGLVLLV